MTQLNQYTLPLAGIVQAQFQRTCLLVSSVTPGDGYLNWTE